MKSYTLGISCYYHDASATILQGTRILGAIQEERLSRKKNDDSFPIKSIQALLNHFEISPDQIDSIVYYEKPFLTFERLLETYHAYAPKGFLSFLKVMPIWIKDKIFIKKKIQQELKELGFNKPQIYFSEHHLSHAASAFYPSPFDKAAIVTIDGVGEWATTGIWYGENNKIEQLKEINFPHSLGLFYSAFTYYCGFKVNNGEYKLMGLAPYAKKYPDEVEKQVKIIKEHLISIKNDGSFTLNMDYFSYATTFKMVDDEKWKKLFGVAKRTPESELTSAYQVLALACQKVTEEIILKLVTHARELTSCENLCLSGGVALNCVANGILGQKQIFKNIWIQPASGDAGSSLGAALAYSYMGKNLKRSIESPDSMQDSLLGNSYQQHHIDHELTKLKENANLEFMVIEDTNLYDFVAEKLSCGFIVGWFQGRMEFGARALGARSILADPRGKDTQSKVNLKIKFRESFRPFAPAVRDIDYDKYFNENTTSPYMQFVGCVRDEVDLPAITHVDQSARIQTVKPTHQRFYNLLSAFEKKTGIGVLLNTSFNIRGEPIVCSPADAIECFLKTHMDMLVLQNSIIIKKDSLN